MTFVEPSAYFIKDLIASIGYPGLALLMALDATILPVPSAVVLGFAGYLSYEGRFDIALVTVVGALGSMCGSLLMYALGRWGGRPFLDRYGRYLGLGEAKMASAGRWFARYGGWAVFISQLLPVARDLIPFPAGIIKMSVERFAALSFLGSLPFCLVLATLGLMAGPSWESTIEVVDRYDMLVLALVMTPLIVYCLLRRSSRR
ncbi:MAG: DedA family protein [Methanomassiliicoccus sp.]|nr:DedA family protein [Methanomassiliicoccus sp.]